MLDTLTRNPNSATNLANGFAASGNTALAAAVATHITALQSYDLGLPDFYQQGFGQPAWIGSSRRLNTFVQDSWALTPALKLDFGLRYELELNTGPIRDSLANFAPRFGFAWSPLRRTVVRGGFGLFFAPINAQFPYIAEIFGEQKIYTTLVPLTGFPGVINPATGQPVTSADIYQTLLAKGVIGNRRFSRLTSTSSAYSRHRACLSAHASRSTRTLNTPTPNRQALKSSARWGTGRFRRRTISIAARRP